MAEELWRPIADSEGYEVSNLGRVRSLRAMGRAKVQHGGPRLMTARPTKAGYIQVSLNRQREGRYSNRYVHRLVAEAFIGPCPEGMEVAHGDGNPGNNAASNLRYATRSENHADKYRHGTMPHGETHYRHKLTAAQAIEICTAILDGEDPERVASKNGISPSKARRIACGYTWTKITAPARASRAEQSLRGVA